MFTAEDLGLIMSHQSYQFCSGKPWGIKSMPAGEPKASWLSLGFTMTSLGLPSGNMTLIADLPA